MSYFCASLKSIMLPVCSSLVALLVACLCASSARAVSVGYYNSRDVNTKDVIVNSGLRLAESPNAEHVADLYARLCGLPPILNEGNVNLPHLNMFAKKSSEMPLLVQFAGSELPLGAISVVQASSSGAKTTDLQSVKDVLLANGIDVSTSVLQGSASEVRAWLSEQSAPVVMLYNEETSVGRRTQRVLEGDDGNKDGDDGDDDGASTVTPLTEFQISEYQICLWVAVMFALLILSSVCMVVNMEVVPDSLLYAKFQSSRTGKHD